MECALGKNRTVTDMPEASPRAVEILVDGSGRLGALSYLVPDGVELTAGLAVEVPFGKGQRHGLVLGPSGTPERATREVLHVWGPRVSERDLAVTRQIAEHYFADLSALAARLSPSTGRGSAALDCGALSPRATIDLPAASRRRRYLLHGPLDDGSLVVASEACRLAERSEAGQVLVLCPTVEGVESVIGHFAGGAVRLDGAAPAGSWRAFADGTARVGVGTRGAALYSAARLEGIVVLDESHPGHYEARTPYTNARDVAILRSRLLDVPLSLVGSLPSSSGLGAGVKVQPVGGAWPQMRLFARGDSALTSVAPGPLAALISRARRRGADVTVVLAKRGEARRVCAGCAIERPCTQCGAVGCSHRASAPCVCGEVRVRRLGWDEGRLSEVFGAGLRVVSMAELDEHRDLGLVIIFDVDGLLRAPGMTPESLAASVVVRAARAAGVRGTVAAVSAEPDQPMLRALFAEASSESVARRIWALAKEHQLAPFGHTVQIWVGRPARPSTRSWPGTVFGPRRVRDEWEILVRLGADELSAFAPVVARLRARGKVRVRVD